MWAHPGKKLLFMGGELAQPGEWSESGSLDWDVLDLPGHAGVQALVRDLNAAYRDEPALWEVDVSPSGFEWLVVDARDDNVLAFARRSAAGDRLLVCVANLSPGRARGVGGAAAARRAAGARCSTPTPASTAARTSATRAPWSQPTCRCTGGRARRASTLPPLGVVWLAPVD